MHAAISYSEIAHLPAAAPQSSYDRGCRHSALRAAHVAAARRRQAARIQERGAATLPLREC